MGYRLPSESEYADTAKSDFTLLPPDDYMVEVKEIIVQKDQLDIYDKNTPQRVRDTLQVRLRVISFANGESLVDEDGDEVADERLFFAFVDPTRVGLIPQPSFARKFFSAAVGVEVGQTVEFDSYDELVGKRLIASTIIKPNAKGVKKNKVTDFRLIRRRPAKAKAATDPKADAASKLSDPGVVAEAKDIFFADELPF